VKVAFACLMLLVAGCATTPTQDIYVVKAMSDRIARVEEALKVDQEKKATRANRYEGYLTEEQKEFIRLMMDYFGGKE